MLENNSYGLDGAGSDHYNSAMLDLKKKNIYFHYYSETLSPTDQYNIYTIYILNKYILHTLNVVEHVIKNIFFKYLHFN